MFPDYDNLYALAPTTRADARAAAINRLMALLAPDAPDAPDPDRHRRLLALLIRATASPILAARPAAASRLLAAASAQPP